MLNETLYLTFELNSRIYDRLYAEYDRLHKYFGEGENDVMKRLKAIKIGEEENI